MINMYGKTYPLRIHTAEKMGVTPSAICQYLSNKRGKIKIVDENILKEISVSAKRIIEDDKISIIDETCRIMRLVGFVRS